MAKRRSEQPRGASIGSRHGGRRDERKSTDTPGTGKAHRTPTERERLMQDPNLNQAGNERGSGDQAQGSQTGSDVDPIPE
jgi:hypothetical protein